MSGRLEVVHRTVFDYVDTVPASFNEARLTPVSQARQQVLEHEVSITPLTWRHEYVDYWGSRVVAFEVLAAHRRLEVVGRTLLQVAPAGPAPQASWELLRDPVTTDRMVEWLATSSVTDPGGQLREAAERACAGSSPSQVAAEICGRVSRELTYRPGVTGVATTARDAWAHRSGVCQDYAHLCLGALRAVGVPARYVSGYLHPDAEAGVGVTVAGESHAWVEWWAGEWYGWDPTNDTAAGADHVVVGRGREYADVAPLTGVLSAGVASQLEVSVEVTRR